MAVDTPASPPDVALFDPLSDSDDPAPCLRSLDDVSDPDERSPDEPSLDDPSPDEPLAAPAFDGAGRRSFLAQPVPLKWTAGALIALRSGPPPQSGHVLGGSAWTPWTISDRRPQEAQS